MATPTDDERFRTLYRRHHPVIMAYLARRVGSQDAADAADLYRVIEEEILPAWETRSEGIPREWTARMRHAMATCIPGFNTHRMVADYVQQVYRKGT